MSGKNLITWRKLLEQKFIELNLSYNDIEHMNILDSELDIKWSASYDIYPDFMPFEFIVWTKDYILYSHNYDNFYELRHIKRNPF